MAEPNGSGNVNYTVKELIARQDGKLDAIIASLGSKAERSDVDQLVGRIRVVEAQMAQQAGSSSMGRWALPIFVSMSSLAVATIALIRVLSG